MGRKSGTHSTRCRIPRVLGECSQTVELPVLTASISDNTRSTWAYKINFENDKPVFGNIS